MTMLTRWEPFRDLGRLQDEMNRLFRAGESVGWTPACDVYEDEEAVALRVVARVDDDREVAWREDGLEALAQPGAADAACERDDRHDVPPSPSTPVPAAAPDAPRDGSRANVRPPRGVFSP